MRASAAVAHPIRTDLFVICFSCLDQRVAEDKRTLLLRRIEMHVDLFIPAKDGPAKRECDLVFNTAH
jgi:hypothetical protein